MVIQWSFNRKTINDARRANDPPAPWLRRAKHEVNDGTKCQMTPQANDVRSTNDVRRQED